jgi:hypothetical protein
LNDSPTFGAKVTAWYLPRQYNWQPQIGLELDYTKFTADLDPQTAGATGTSLTPGMELVAVQFLTHRDFSVNVLAANLLFRYPIWATPELPQGRFYPYIGVGLGVQRAHTSVPIVSHLKKRVIPQPSKVWSASSFSFFETLLSSENGKELLAGTRSLTTVSVEFHRDTANGGPSLQTS